MNKIIYSIGHSTLPAAAFLRNLQTHDISTVVDCRSIPRSRFFPQYNQKTLVQSLRTAGLAYIWKGENLGGKLENVDFEGAAIWLAELAKKTKVAVLCSEGDYKKCHRHTAIQPAVEKLGLKMRHISTGGIIVN